MRIMAFTTPNGIIIDGNVGSDHLSELIPQDISKINATNYRLIDRESDTETWQFLFAKKGFRIRVKSDTKRVLHHWSWSGKSKKIYVPVTVVLAFKRLLNTIKKLSDDFRQLNSPLTDDQKTTLKKEINEYQEQLGFEITDWKLQKQIQKLIQEQIEKISNYHQIKFVNDSKSHNFGHFMTYDPHYHLK